jgi:hypothetical protein
MESNPFFDDQPRMTPLLKVISILSIVASSFQFLSAVYSYFTAESNYVTVTAMSDGVGKAPMPGWLKSIIGDPQDLVEIAKSQMENKVPLLLLGVLAAGLCLWGVIQMRKLKKQGLYIYVIGELLPFLTMTLFMSSAAFNGVAFYATVFFTLLFIILYWTQRSCLVRE